MTDVNELRLLVVEGPAGAGKTTLINDIDNDNSRPFYFYKTKKFVPEGVRDFGLRNFDNGAKTSLVKDTSQLLDVLNFAVKEPDVGMATWVHFTDRGWISQYVYGSLRRGEVYNEARLIESVKTTSNSVVSIVNSWIQRRMDLPDFKLTIDMRLLVYLPPYQTIAHRREWSGKSYPYALSKEIEFYQGVVDTLSSLEARHLLVTDSDPSIPQLTIDIWDMFNEEPKQ